MISKNIVIATVFAAQQVSASNVFRGCQEPSMQQDFDLDAYLGVWYEQRRDKDCSYESGVCNTAHYSLNEDGTIRVRNNELIEDSMEWGGGVGKVRQVDPSKNEGYL